MSEDKEPNRFEKRIRERKAGSPPNRFQRRLERVKKVRDQEVSLQKRAIAAGAAAGFAVMSLCGIFAAVGVYNFDWRFLLLGAFMGFFAGLVFGANRVSEGAAAGIFAGLWIFMELVAASVVLVIEGVAVAIAAIFSAISF